MEDRWPYPIPMMMQRQAGSAPRPHTVHSPPVCPDAVADDVAAPEIGHAASTSEAEIRFDY